SLAPYKADADSLHGPRPFGEQRQALNGEERGRSAVAAAGGKGNHHVVNESAEGESGEYRPPRSAPGRERPEQKPVRQVAERGIPAPAPEVADACRGDGPVHERLRGNTDRSPRAREQVERAEVQDEDESNHANPADEKGLVRGQERRDRVEHAD